jgi:Rrf2 family protein
MGIQEISQEIESPMYFTGKILQTLVKAGLISSAKGPNGGFYLPRDAAPVPVIRILEVLGCDAFFRNCALGLTHCSDRHPCPIHHDFKPYREGLLQLLSRTTIQQLALEIIAGNGHITNLDVGAGSLTPPVVNDQAAADAGLT